VTKRGTLRVIASAASLVMSASSLGVFWPATAATYNGTSGTIDCSVSGTITIANNLVTTHTNCSGSVEIPAGVTSIGNAAFDNANELTSINVHPDNPTFSSSGGVLFNKALTALVRYPSGQSATSYTIPASATSIRRSAFKDAQYIQSVYVPSSITSIQTLGFSRASSLAMVHFMGNAPTSVSGDAFSFVANGAKAVIKSGATGFANVGQTWNGLIVEEERFTITYNAANGSSVSSGSFTSGGTIQTAPTSTRAGYTLLGWSTSANGSVVKFPYTPTATSDITLFAIWSANNNAVSYNTGGGSAVTSGSFTTGGTIQTAPTSTRPGYTLAGWSTSANGSVLNFPYTPTATSDITLFAIWSASTNTVTYNTGGGSAVTSGSFTTGGTIQAAPTSTRTGYTFLGWSTSANGSVLNFPYTPTATSDITLFAIWQLNTEELKCSTGLPIQAGDTSPTYSFTNGVVSAGSDCVGAVVIPSGVTAIPDTAFVNAPAIASITVNEANLNYASINGVLFNKSLTTLLKYPAANSANSYTIPNGVTSIGNYAFDDTSSLVAITIPASVTSIGDNSFDHSIKVVRFLGVAPANVSASAFSNLSPNAAAYLPGAFASFNLDQNGKWRGLSVTTLFAPKSNNGYANCTQDGQATGVIIITDKKVSQEVGCFGEVSIPTGVTTIEDNAFEDATGLVSVSIPSSVTSIGDEAFAGSRSLIKIYFLGKAPAQVGDDAFKDIHNIATVYRKAGTRFKLINDRWNGLPVFLGHLAKFSGNGQNSGLVPSEVMRPANQSLVAPENFGGLSKIGHTFAGWNTLASGRGTTYIPGATVQMPLQDMTLYAMWTRNPVKATNVSRPVITGFVIATSKGRNILSATSGAWMGYPNPSVSYQWYSCTQQISTQVSTAPQSCSSIAGATSPKLALTQEFKGMFVAVEVTAESTGTTPTRSFSMSTVRVK